MYDQDREKILHLYQLGVPFQKIITTHLGYGKAKRYCVNTIIYLFSVRV